MINWREGSLVFVCVGLTKNEQRRVARNEDSAVVPIAMAQK